MASIHSDTPRRLLIVSSHPLFGQGLKRLLQSRPKADVIVVGVVSSVDEAMSALSASSAPSRR